MGFTAAKLLNKVRKAITKPKKKSPAQESMNYRKKLSREQNKRAKNEDLLPGETRPKSKVKKKADKVEQMSDARLKREKQLANPYLTYEDRAKLLGGMKKGGMLKEPTNPGLKKLPSEVRNKMGYMEEGGIVDRPRRMKKPSAPSTKRPSAPKSSAPEKRKRKGDQPLITPLLKKFAEMRKAGKNVGNLRKGYKHGGSVKGKCRMDGIAIRGKTRAKERSK